MTNTIRISRKEAVRKLNDSNLIKVLKTEDGVCGLVPRFLPRAEVVQMINENVMEDVGQESKKKGFVMSLQNKEGVVFIEGNCNH